MDTKKNRLDLESVRARLSKTEGKEYWRCLDELAATEEFEDMLHREFPREASVWNNPLGRRNFMKLMGASLAFAGLNGCGIHEPKETIVPYVQQPEEIVLGKPLYFATAMTQDGVATGLLAESHEGRPTKIEGNPQHPGSLGSTDLFCQASVLSLYDPDRSQSVTYLEDIRTWSSFVGALQGAMAAQLGRQGAGLRILTQTITSPSLADQINSLLAAYPQAKWYQYDPAALHNTKAGATLAFGQYVNTVHQFDKADVVLSLDSDFLFTGPGMVRYVRDFTSRRRLLNGSSKMNRLYVVESTPSNTGAMSDHRLPLRATEIGRFAASIAAALGVGEPAAAPAAHDDWINAIANDLKSHRGSGIVIAGESQPPYVHALVHAMNQSLGNAGAALVYTDPLEARPVDQVASLRELVADMNSGKVDLLLIVGGNPVYNAPADLDFAGALTKVPLRAHMGMYLDETSELCHWHVPETHFLESWGDARAYDGTVTMIQPLIAPLYHGKTPYELLAAFTKRPEESAYEVVQTYWKSQNLWADFEKGWRQAIHDGFISGSAFKPKQVELKPAGSWASEAQAQQPAAQGSIEITFRPDPSVYDGQYANNGWLQELPKPITKLTWDNAALISPNTANRLGLSYDVAARGGEHGKIYVDTVELELQGQKLKAPAWIMPGQPDDCITLHLGYGRTRTGRVGTGVGFNAYSLRASNAMWTAPGARVTKVDGEYILACTQFHHSMEGRDQVREATLAEYRNNPEFAREKSDKEKPPSLYPGFEYKDYAWGMAVDLNSCVGCNACVVACQSENNIPIVGKEEVTHGREMHWIRIDRYYSGNNLENPETHYQPVMCQQCENAPCELVCPVGATTHSAEGLNDMVYNRCVGTRYCSNNCPYKVRRFNFFEFADWETPSLKMMRNPDVTVRSRGVMEKCTYCVQRISHAKIEAEKDGRQVRDGDIATACEAACPANAITFGNINDSGSRVAKLKAEPRNYGLLADLNTRPRTTYLASVRNPNPDLEKA